MGLTPPRPPLSDAERLLRVVRRMQPGDLADTLRAGLADAELLRLVTARPRQASRHLACRRAELT